MVRNEKAEFDGERARLYEEALEEYPRARLEDIKAMRRLLCLSEGERILGVGEGNGYFCKVILQDLGSSGLYMVSDPSEDQLENLKKRVSSSSLEIQIAGAEEIEVLPRYYDKVWSFGAFHHCPHQTEAMKRIYSALKKGGRAVICDVFQGSRLAQHFDGIVAKYCVSGHEAKFLSEEFARTLCFLAGFDDSKVEIIDLPQEWKFDSENDLGRFIYKLHALTLLPGSETEKIAQTIQGCKDILGIEKKRGRLCLHWPLKCLRAEK